MTPPGAKSSLAAESPSPLTPGNWATKPGVTAALMMFVVFPAETKPENTKSEAVMLATGLQGKPAGPSGDLRSATQKSKALETEDDDEKSTEKRKIISIFMMSVCVREREKEFLE